MQASLLARTSLGRPHLAALRPRGPRALSRACNLRPGRAGRRLSKGAARGPVCQKPEPHTGSEQGPPHDLEWRHVAQEIKQRLALALRNDEASRSRLQAWLSETKLSSSGETDSEQENQTEVAAKYEGELMGLDKMQLDVKAWLGGSEAELDSKMAGVLVLRMLQAYHKETGTAFEETDDDAVWRLGGFLPGELVSALDHELLQRSVRAFVSMPFSMV